LNTSMDLTKLSPLHTKFKVKVIEIEKDWITCFNN
jgi:hypothetical protein